MFGDGEVGGVGMHGCFLQRITRGELRLRDTDLGGLMGWVGGGSFFLHYLVLCERGFLMMGWDFSEIGMGFL